MNLYVRVVWLGPNLREVLQQATDIYLRKKSNKSLVILSWTPSEVVIQDDKFVSVTFKHCTFSNEPAKNSSLGCYYELMRLTKYMWVKLETLAPDAYGLLQNLHFQEEEFNSLLTLYSESKSNDTSKY